MFNIKGLWFDFWGKKDDYKSNVLNSIFFRVDKILGKIFDDNLSTPPVSPSDGDMYRIGENATGRWVDKEDYIAFYYNGSWRLIAPAEGMHFYDKSVGKFLYYDGSLWKSVAECYSDHNASHNYCEFEHEDWSDPGALKIDVDRLEYRFMSTGKLRIFHDKTLGYVPDEHEDWCEPGLEQIAIERIPRDEGIVAMKEPSGFENRDISTLDFDDTTRTFSITGRFNYWWQGVNYKCALTITHSVVIDDISGFYWIYFNEQDLLFDLISDHSLVSNIIRNECLVGGVYWNATDQIALSVGDERHGIYMSNETHHRLHESFGCLWEDGAEISGYTLADDSDSGITFDLTDMEIYDEDIEIEIEDGDPDIDYEQILTGDAEIPVIHRDDVDGSWTQVAASTLPYLTAGGGSLAYSNDDGDGTWSQVEVGNQKFVTYTLIATNDWRLPVKMVQGTTEYANQVDAAEDAKNEVITWGRLPAIETCFLYRFVMQTGAAFGGTKKAKIIEVVDIRGVNTKNFRFANLHG